MTRRARSLADAFRFAFAGLWYVLRTQRNARVHALASVLVVALAWWLQLQPLEWALLILAMGLVWLTELLNTALEAIVDLVNPEIHPLAKAGKDVGAAAVLIASLAASVIGFLVLGPPLWRFFLRIR